MDPVETALSEAASQERHAALLEYDFLKHLTTVALTAIGAIVALAGSVFQNTPDRDTLWVSAGLFLIGALAAFAAQDKIVRDAKQARPTGRFVTVARWASVMAIGAAFGAVLRFAYEQFG